MKVKTFNATTPGRRHYSSLDFALITKKKPLRGLVHGKKRISGRGNTGRITVRFRGGGHKRRYRIIDFVRNKMEKGRVHSIEYDPNRSANICLIHYIDGIKKYIIAPAGLQVNDYISSGVSVETKVGNTMPLSHLPLGAKIHNIEVRPGKGGQLVRSAGVFASLMSKGKKYAKVKLPSGEIRMILLTCSATIGEVGNSAHGLIKHGKAGRKRWLGIKPHNRGVSMNPVDHPHGGGEGKSSGGRHPVTPWGKSTKGLRTRSNKRTDKMIVRRRSK